MSEKVNAPFSAPSSKSDLILIVEGQKLYVSKLVLSLASPVFERMFEGDFKEKSCMELPLPDKKYDDMVEFLLCVYPSTLKKVSRNNLDAVVSLADEYQVKSLKNKCEAFVLTLFDNKDEKVRVPTNVELIHFLLLADKYSLKKLLEVCMEMSKYRNFDVRENCIKKIPDFKLLSLNTRCEIFSRRLTVVEMSADGVLNTESSGCKYGCHLSTLKSKVKSNCFPLD